MIRHVMLDADGVLQRGGDGILEALSLHLGDHAMQVLTATFPPDGPVLRGEAEVVPLLREELAVMDQDVDVERLYADAWLAIETHKATVDLIHALRGRGYGAHLGTNQDLARARYMRRELGYDELFDVSIYSCEVGASKPSAGFFSAASSVIGAEPTEMLFVDDNLTNVVGARDAGLKAIHWQIDDGQDTLIDLLANYGVRP